MTPCRVIWKSLSFWWDLNNKSKAWESPGPWETSGCMVEQQGSALEVPVAKPSAEMEVWETTPNVNNRLLKDFARFMTRQIKAQFKKKKKKKKKKNLKVPWKTVVSPLHLFGGCLFLESVVLKLFCLVPPPPSPSVLSIDPMSPSLKISPNSTDLPSVRIYYFTALRCLYAYCTWMNDVTVL